MWERDRETETINIAVQVGCRSPCRETIGREGRQQSDEGSHTYWDARPSLHDFAIILLSLEWGYLRPLPAHRRLIIPCPFSCIVILCEEVSITLSLSHFSSGRTTLQHNWPRTVKANACFPGQTMTLSTCKWSSGCDKLYNHQASKGFRAADILGVAPGNVEDLPKLQTRSSEIKELVPSLSVWSQGRDQRAETVMPPLPGVKSMLLIRKKTLEKMSF